MPGPGGQRPALTRLLAPVAGGLAAAIYLLTTVAWTIGERRLFLRRAARAAGAPESAG